MLAASSNKTEAERKLEADTKSLNQVTGNIIVRNTVEGALAGAAIGCGLVLLMGGNGQDCAKGAAVGAVAGGAYGNSVGQKAAQKKVELVKRDQVLANLRGVSAKLGGVETQLRAVVSSQNAELRSLRRQVEGKQISQSQYDARLAAINSNRKVVSAALDRSAKNMAKTESDLKAAQAQGQGQLGTLTAAAASTRSRLERNRKLLALAQ
ncbi:RND family efflux transporter [Pseudodonghicola xiamenensis]|uniref:Glycine zipper n=1 Tax=Pseudodonghicola xiamenensis TaxID=337702 RepID=A0A8J3H8F8_9RHOB|nr:hypothetical protein [Pseudodonghicola xiamenensis]GHG98484.1 hypothetical protein GCM10010961_33850 [Pseudodonghicola xiamenensis]